MRSIHLSCRSGPLTKGVPCAPGDTRIPAAGRQATTSLYPGEPMKIPLVNEQGSNAAGKRTISLRLEHLGKLERVVHDFQGSKPFFPALHGRFDKSSRRRSSSSRLATTFCLERLTDCYQYGLPWPYSQDGFKKPEHLSRSRPPRRGKVNTAAAQSKRLCGRPGAFG